MVAPDPPAPPWPLGDPRNIPPPPQSMRARAEELVRRMATITDLHLRVRLVAEALNTVTWEEGAKLIAELLDVSHDDANGRVVRLALTLALGDEEAVAPERITGMLVEARQQKDATVCHLLASKGAWSAGEGMNIPPPPPGSPSRELTLGERRALARKPDRQSLEKLLLDPEPLVIRNMLRNPRLTEEDVLRIASRRPCRADVLAEIAASQRWVCRPRVQLALVLNPFNRTELSLRLVEILPRSSLRLVAREGTIDPLIREAARQGLGEE